MIDVITAKQALLEEKIGKVGSFVGWEYARTNEWSSRHGTISFDRKLIDYTEGAYTVNINLHPKRVDWTTFENII